MKKMTWLMTGLAVCFVTAAASAQTPIPPLPSGPLLLQPADFSAWQITYQYPHESQQPAAAPGAHAPGSPPLSQGALYAISPARQVTLTITRPAWHAAITDTAGRKIDEWFDGLLVTFQAGGKPDAMRVPMSWRHPLLPNYGAVPFSDMEWISPATYAGLVKVNGRPAIFFKNDTTTAWIDLETRYPIAWERGGEKRTYKPLAPPVAMLTLPDSVIKASEEYKRLKAIMAAGQPGS